MATANARLSDVMVSAFGRAVGKGQVYLSMLTAPRPEASEPAPDRAAAVAAQEAERERATVALEAQVDQLVDHVLREKLADALEPRGSFTRQWLLNRAKAYRLDATAQEKAGTWDPRRTKDLGPAARRAIADELEDLARDVEWAVSD